ncbi:MAG: flagellar basal body-associated FliL family protein [Pseudomonadota bacterium]
MADEDTNDEENNDADNPEGGGKAKKGLSLPITIAGAAVLAAVSGAAAFALAPAGGGEKEDTHTEEHADEGHSDKKSKSDKKKKKKKKGKKDKKGQGEEYAGDAVYVPIEPLIVSLGPEAMAKRLKITLVIEGAPEYQSELTALVPKFRDVLNTYLRAADARDFETPAAMSRVRAHIARRLRIVAPDASIKSVLVTDFILD